MEPKWEVGGGLLRGGVLVIRLLCEEMR
jgi:hypothetical protein